MRLEKTFALCLATLLAVSVYAEGEESGRENQWTAERANCWYDRQKWIVGCDFIPSDAVNQLEMWQGETFSPTVIDRELGWAEKLGFNTVRVYLHSLVWEADAAGFKRRIDRYLAIADRHGIRTVFVFFDDCWNPEAKLGKQPVPRTGVHNSGWVQDPIVSRRADPRRTHRLLEVYVKDILTTFKNDSRILMWDLYNEPGNTGHLETSMSLLKKVFRWARSVNPSQPLTVGVWRLDFYAFNKFSFENSDVITYHCYQNRDVHQGWIHFMKLYGRPLICTEWMGRRFGSTFERVMPMMKKQRVGALSWGLVAGKTNTIYAWDDPHPDGREPKLWFHDILRKDGTPYRQSEVDVIRRLTLGK